MNVAVVPMLVAPAHGSVDRSGPLKQATCVMSAGASTLTVARWIGTVQPGAERVQVQLVVVLEPV